MSKLTSYSRVQVTVEITGSSYGEDWNLGALTKQSGSEAMTFLEQRLRDHNVKIIGEPKVLVITHLVEKS